jgi:hypothetical protein
MRQLPWHLNLTIQIALTSLTLGVQATRSKSDLQKLRVAIMDYARPQYDATLYEDCDGAHRFPNGRFTASSTGGNRHADIDSDAGRLRLGAAPQ